MNSFNFSLEGREGKEEMGGGDESERGRGRSGDGGGGGLWGLGVIGEGQK